MERERRVKLGLICFVRGEPNWPPSFLAANVRRDIQSTTRLSIDLVSLNQLSKERSALPHSKI